MHVVCACMHASICTCFLHSDRGGGARHVTKVFDEPGGVLLRLVDDEVQVHVQGLLALGLEDHLLLVEGNLQRKITGRHRGVKKILSSCVAYMGQTYKVGRFNLEDLVKYIRTYVRMYTCSCQLPLINCSSIEHPSEQGSTYSLSRWSPRNA